MTLAVKGFKKGAINCSCNEREREREKRSFQMAKPHIPEILVTYDKTMQNFTKKCYSQKRKYH